MTEPWAFQTVLLGKVRVGWEAAKAGKAHLPCPGPMPPSAQSSLSEPAPISKGWIHRAPTVCKALG